MAIKVYGNSRISTATLRVLICLVEKDLDFEFIHVDLASGEHKKPHYLSLNPFGEVPFFEDGEIKLYESRAIMQYIAYTYADKGTDLISKDPKKRAAQLMWMEVESQKFEPAVSKLVWELCMKWLIFGMKSDDVVVKENEKRLERVLDVYEARLSESKYLAGDCFSLPDLNHIPSFQFLMETQTKKMFDARPHVSAWIDDIVSRPCWAKVYSMPE